MTGSGSETFYPSLDGAVKHVLSFGSGITWAEMIAAPGTGSDDAVSQTSIAYIVSDSVTGRWKSLNRAIYLFGGLDGYPLLGATILSAIFSVWGVEKVDYAPWLPSTNIYSSNPASEVELIPADYACLGSTPFCDNPVSYLSWNANGFNNFTLNAVGLAALAAAIRGDGILRLGIRNANYDVAGVSPTWISMKGSGVSGTFVEQGDPFRPKLVITYSVPTPPAVTTNPATELGAIAATLNGTLDDDGGEACECGFEFGLDTGYGTITATESKTTGQTFSQVIGGLVPNTTYHFRAFATNSSGTGYGADRTFTTALIISRAFALAREEL